ncbi:hypothetical protein NE237_026963 [Protea cynaroides]|uniref:Uncharacterized protein n=1 Tax=Protea cynaroides TaxID=273540 RepID=A0A9Q0JSJ2_9MAGN|nr:hypothetical protein NE237_026963 [Protea cynaroides]
MFSPHLWSESPADLLRFSWEKTWESCEISAVESFLSNSASSSVTFESLVKVSEDIHVKSKALYISGYGWNTELKQLTYHEDNVWKSYISEYPQAKYYNN